MEIVKWRKIKGKVAHPILSLSLPIADGRKVGVGRNSSGSKGRRNLSARGPSEKITGPASCEVHKVSSAYLCDIFTPPPTKGIANDKAQRHER